MHRNFDFILFPGTLKCHGACEIGPEAVNRLWLGEKFEKRCTKILPKNEKNEKSSLCEIFINFYSKSVKKSINFK